MAFEVPLLLLTFNRPHLVELQLNRLRTIRPLTLFISSDGPRKNHKSDAIQIDQCRKLVEAIDWPCDVHKKYEATNLGCGLGVSSAISWFFDHVEEGIIVEDDCLLSESFFPYCAHLLEKYRCDDRVAGISGDFRILSCERPDNEYGFTSFPQIWGWATWRSVWRQYDFEINRWDGSIDGISGLNALTPSGQRFWKKNFEKIRQKKIDTWDFQLAFLVLSNGWSFVHPMRNLVSNLGYASDSTHTKFIYDPASNLPSFEVGFPLVANETYDAYDKHLAECCFVDKPIVKKILQRLLRYIKRAGRS